MSEGSEQPQYSSDQMKMLFLYDTLRESLLFKKYYAHRMNRFEKWNFGGDIIVAAAASGSLTGATIFKSYVGEKFLTVLLLASTVAAIVKPLLKLNKKIANASKLQRDYLSLYQKLNRLRREIQHCGQLVPKCEAKFNRLRDTFDRLGLRNEAVEDKKRMMRFQDEVEEQIPHTTLWLPPSA
jgi:hypothetical protein